MCTEYLLKYKEPGSILHFRQFCEGHLANDFSHLSSLNLETIIQETILTLFTGSTISGSVIVEKP
jgi:hypothetical protein